MEGHVACILQLLCFGANIDQRNMDIEPTELFQSILDRFHSLRDGNGMTTNLMSNEERRFMWNLAFSFTIKYRAAAFKAFYAIRSFVTFNGIFICGEKSLWRKRDTILST